jgi:hypothetical protein
MPTHDNIPEDNSPAPPVPASSEAKPPQGGWQRYRFLIICSLVLAFIIYIFAAKESRMVEQATPPGQIVAKNLEIELKTQPGVLRLEPGLKALATHPAPGGSGEGGGPAPAETPAVSPVPVPGKPEEPAKPLMAAPSAAPPIKTSEPAAKPEEPVRPVIPPPPPLPAVAEKASSLPVKGEAFTRALIKITDDQVNKPLFGWRPNSILFGKMGVTDDVNNLQLGVLEVIRRTVVVLNENMSRFALTEAQNPYLNNAMNFFMVSPEKYWFPSASGKYKEAIADLEHYIDDLKHNRSRFYARVDNLIALMNHFRDLLGSAFHNLIKDTEADGSSVSWFVADDYFYFTQGVALGMAEILEGVKEDFADQLARKNSTKLVDDAIHALHTAAHLHPWLITNAAKDGILANHRANMGTYIGEAEHIIFTLMSVLATN